MALAIYYKLKHKLKLFLSRINYKLINNNNIKCKINNNIEFFYISFFVAYVAIITFKFYKVYVMSVFYSKELHYNGVCQVDQAGLSRNKKY